jgi:hypothetical protein
LAAELNDRGEDQFVRFSRIEAGLRMGIDSERG